MKYPRDLTGYGENKPKFLWPNKSVIAVQFVINYEEGGENKEPRVRPVRLVRALCLRGRPAQQVHADRN